MNFDLSSCPSCYRHVRASETSCPFCHAAISPNARHAGKVRLGLAAACAIGMGMMTTAGTCSPSGPVSTQAGPPHETPPAACTAPFAWGSTCSGDEYLPLSCGVGWAICEDGGWGFTSADPMHDSYYGPCECGGAGDEGGADAGDGSQDGGANAGDGGEEGGADGGMGEAGSGTGSGS